MKFLENMPEKLYAVLIFPTNHSVVIFSLKQRRKSIRSHMPLFPSQSCVIRRVYRRLPGANAENLNYLPLFSQPAVQERSC